MRSDADLVEAWGRGDHAAARELVDRYYRSVIRFFDLRVGAAAEDLTQRTFLSCVEHRERLRTAASFRPYLFAIARSLLFNHLRSKSVESGVFETGDITSAPDPGPTASRIVAQSQEHSLLLRAMQTLDPDAQILIVLFHWEGLKVPELAEIFGAPVSTITTRLSRARKALRDEVASLPAVPAHRHALLSDLEAWIGSVSRLDVASPRR